MTTTEKIISTITNFVKGGDNSDIEMIDKILHKDFRVTNNGFMGKPGVTIIDKEKYLFNIKNGIFGGKPRKMTIENINFTKTIAQATLYLESEEYIFVSYNSLILDTDNEWKLINNLAIVEEKTANI